MMLVFANRGGSVVAKSLEKIYASQYLLPLLPVLEILSLQFMMKSIVIFCVNPSNGNSERVIIDIDFRSHFEIAKAVDSYNRILNSLPVIYVRSLTRFKQLLQLMVEAARLSLEQNLLLFPLWRSLAYLQAKWYSDTTLASILLLAISNAKDI
ncbi:hypothetical protein J1N35_014813 [Gossypium stocksii]|uniref:Uncharacterized protein n=1 Tax=Gossypium stocksii TaxID=47602 RepID=A0A9D3VUY8_9ROSI|nr:hypothetical protein J1N35_014813 [Gossypium stocksii]